MTVQIYYTADIVRPDGSDTGVYGDPCEEGTGATLETGWLDPNWSMREVYDEPDHVRPDAWTPDDGPMIDWIAERLSARLYVIESDGGPRTYYSGQADEDPYTGVSTRVAAHIDAPDSILSAVGYALARMSRYPYPEYND